MMKLFLMLLFVFIFYSCKRIWTQKDREEVRKACLAGASKDMQEAKARAYCNCMLTKLEKRYPDVSDVGYLKFDTAFYRIGQDCLKTSP